MTDKLVHVKAYVKDDGTKVREHYRGGVMTTSIMEGGCEVDTDNGSGPLGDCTNSEEFMRQLELWLESDGLLKNLPRVDKEMSANAVLKGGVSKTDIAIGGGDILEALQAITLMVRIGGKLAIEGIKIASSIKYAIKNFDKIGEARLIPQMEGAVQLMRQNQSNSVQIETQTLERLTNSRTQREYKKLYDTYVKQRELNRKTEDILNRIEYSLSNKDYEGLIVELQNYQTIQQECMKAVNEEYLATTLAPTIPDETDIAMPQPLTAASPFDWKELRRTGLHNYPEIQKDLIDAAMERFILPRHNAYDANELWQAASHNFDQISQYIELNAYFVSNISKLPEEFQDIVQQKVLKQFGLADVKGLLFKPNSTLSSKIADSPEFKNYIITNKQDLLQGNTVNGSLHFKSSKNLQYSLGKADILDTYINTNGDIVAYVLDTYDFNENDLDWKVEWAYNIQKNKLLTPFYTLNVIIVPLDVWFRWF